MNNLMGLEFPKSPPCGLGGGYPKVDSHRFLNSDFIPQALTHCMPMCMTEVAQEDFLSDHLSDDSAIFNRDTVYFSHSMSCIRAGINARIRVGQVMLSSSPSV